MRDIDKQLYDAAKRGDDDELVALLSKGADAKAADFRGVTPLMVATLRDHARCVQALLPFSDAKAVDEEGCTALIYASQHMRLECAKALLAASDVDRKDYEGLTALDHAKAWGDEALVGLIESHCLARQEASELARATLTAGHAAATSRL